MESRFADLRRRDTSVSMLRVKQSRRRSQSQKENRERVFNSRRQLDKLPELEASSLDASMANMSTLQEKTQISAKPAKTAAAQDRLKRLQSWKEQKELKKEKERRERESKGVFKIGRYQPKDSFSLVPLPEVPAASSRPKEKKVNPAPAQSSRVTRSMKQQLHQEPQKPLAMQNPNTRANKVQPSAERATRIRAAPVKPASAATKTAAAPARRAASTRSAVTKAPVLKANPQAKDGRTTRSRATVKPLPPSPGGARNCKAETVAVPPVQHQVELMEPEVQDEKEAACPLSPVPRPAETDLVVNPGPEEPAPALDSASPSFAPQGFVFQAPAGLSSFKFEPLTPRSADSFLTPSPSFGPAPAPAFSIEPGAPSVPTVPPASASPQEAKHDVPYFRSQMSNETDRLSGLCVHWEAKVEDEAIPEEMRDRMRTAVGQARLLMKERFKQFGGLVDDCDLGRGEKVTTCSDLQGFWDMVYFQVEDVNRKFDTLKEAESRGWTEEHRSPPRQRKVVKKTSAAPAKPTGNKAAAKSRLAAVKAAMKARQQAAEAEKTAKDAANDEDTSLQPPGGAQTVVFDGGFFQVESPVKPAVRRSGRLSSALLPQPSPCLTPRRVSRRSLALTQTPVPASPAQTVHSAGPKSGRGSPQASQQNLSVCFSPVKLAAQSPEKSQSEEAAAAATLGPEMQDLPAVCVEQLDLSEAPPLSPRQSSSPSLHQTPPPSSVPSFSLTPCSSPAQAAEEVPMETGLSVCSTADGSLIEEIPGLDFERYLQPSQRCSLSPRDTVTMETPLPMGADVEMESPRGQPEEPLADLEPALSTVSSVFTLQSPQVQTAESALLLFTPDLKDRIRQSTCPSDLMVFTPPI